MFSMIFDLMFFNSFQKLSLFILTKTKFKIAIDQMYVLEV